MGRGFRFFQSCLRRLTIETGRHNLQGLADVTYARALIEGIQADAVLADKAYDANHVLEYLVGPAKSRKPA